MVQVSCGVRIVVMNVDPIYWECKLRGRERGPLLRTVIAGSADREDESWNELWMLACEAMKASPQMNWIGSSEGYERKSSSNEPWTETRESWSEPCLCDRTSKP